MNRLINLLNLIRFNTKLHKEFFIFKYPSKLSLVVLKHLYEARLIRSYYFCSYQQLLFNYFSELVDNQNISKLFFVPSLYCFLPKLPKTHVPYVKIYILFFDSCFFYNSIIFYSTINKRYSVSFNKLQKLTSNKHFNFRYFLLISTNCGVMTSDNALKLKLGGILLFVIE